MKKFTTLCCGLLMAALAQATIIQVPADYPTIQQGIDAASNGDTVLVSPGTYVENINYNGKSITVASLFMTTQDKAYIAQTIIDGNQAGSVVTFNGYDYYDQSAKSLCGFNIQNGKASYAGGGIYLDYYTNNLTLENLIIKNNSATYEYYGSQGGGIFCSYSYNTSQIFKDILLTNNSADYGGGIYFDYSSPVMENVTITNNTANYGGGVYFSYETYPVFDTVNRCSIYQNSATYGSDLYNSYSYQNIPVTLKKFTVKHPKSAQAYPLSGFTFDILQGVLPQDDIILFVSPSGDDNNDGLSASKPMKTNHHALDVANADPVNLYNIYLMNGTYSPTSNGEIFPLVLTDYVGLWGESREGVILDADSTERVISISNQVFVNVSTLTITGGYSSVGGGIYIYNASPKLDYLTITNNSAYSNYGEGIGGGIYCYSSNPVLKDVSIFDNSAKSQGGGIYFGYSYPVFDTIFRCNIYNNSASLGSDLYNYNYYYGNIINIVLDTFTILYPTQYIASPLAYFNFDILNGKLEQVEADLFVSPGGDNENSGLSADEPLKTIRYAMIKMMADSLHPHTVHLFDGTYSPSGNGDFFPVYLNDYASITGSSGSEVILDAEGLSGVVELRNNLGSSISNLTITGGFANYGGGIFLENSSPVLDNLKITNNTTGLYDGYGGGIYCYSNSNPVIENSIINSNQSGYFGGGIFCEYNSNPIIENCNISGNQSGYYGGGIFGYNSYPDLINVTVSDNSAEYCGGGIYMYSSIPKLDNVKITENFANYGGGMYLSYSFPEFDSVNRCNIYLNNASEGNDLYCNEGIVSVILDTFSVLFPTKFFASPIANFSFDILNGKLEQVEADLFVSPGGDNENSGLSADEPLKTIRYAMIKMMADSLHPHTVHLLDGTYSPAGNGDFFPVYLNDYTSIIGSSGSEVILDAEGLSRVVELRNNLGSHISNLTITGGFANNGGGIYIENSSPVLYNLKILNNSTGYGYGGGIYCNGNSNPVIENSIINSNQSGYGGGIYSGYNTYPDLINVSVSSNSAEYYGGGIYMYSSYPKLENVTISENSADYGGGMYLNYTIPIFDSLNRCNIYKNFASKGKDLYSESFLEVIVDTFTVLHPKSYHAYPLGNFSFDIQHGMIPQQNIELFASPEGNDTNSGLSPDDPLKTINYALSISNADSVNLFTIHLSDGTYSPTITGENFPISFMDYGNLIGESKEGTILDAEGQSGVIYMENSGFGEISDLSITGGQTYSGGAGIYLDHSIVLLKNLNIINNITTGSGGGIYLYYSNPVLQNVEISNNLAAQGGGVFCDYNSNPITSILSVTGNTATYFGGGIYFQNSNPEIENVTVSYNTALNAGGIYFDNSNPVLKNVTISENTAIGEGGGIYTSYSNPVFDTVSRCNIYLNQALTGKDLYSNSFLEVAVDTFTVMHPKTSHASPLNNFIFDILHGMIPQQDIVLYASPEGDDGNSGLTQDDPLKTIQHAIEVSNSDSVNFFTIQLKNGIYSYSKTGETFPLSFVDYGNLIGESQEGVILDAEGQSQIINLDGSNFGEISNLTITGGHISGNGGGMYCNNSMATLKNLSINDNDAGGYGGGIYCNNSNLVLQNIKLFNNDASFGGGIYCKSSWPVFENAIISKNEATKYGGGLYILESYPIFQNSLINSNYAEFGGGIYTNISRPEFKHTSVYENAAETGGGIYFDYSDVTFDSVNRSSIYMNYAETGNDLFSTYEYSAHLNIVLDTFSVLYPTEIFATPLEIFSFDILNGKIEQVDADLFVSPMGDNDNSGLTADEPLKTIRLAMLKISANILQPHTIHLLEGVYSPSTTGEKFPLHLYDFLSLKGTSAGEVILDAEGEKRIIELTDNEGSVISNLAITGGYSPDKGGGLYCSNSNPIIQNVSFIDNKAGTGGGLYLYYSNPGLTNVAFYENHASKGSAVYCYSSSPSIINSTISDNTNSDDYGGGIYCGAGSFAKIVNSILWNNAPHEVMLQGVYSPNSVEVSYSDIMDGQDGIFISGVGTINWLEGNINEDPVFVGSGELPYQINDLSPCIDAGTPDTTGLNLPEYDLAGNPRFVKGRVDIGAYEWNIMVGQDEMLTGTIGFEVYPNPVKEHLFIDYALEKESVVSIQLYNTTGTLVQSITQQTGKTGKNQSLINTANLQPGLYFIRLQAGGQIATKKVVKL